MADNENVEKTEGKAGGGKKKLIFLLLGAVIVIGGAVGALFAFGVIGDKGEKEAPVEEIEKPGPKVEFEVFKVNIEDKYLIAQFSIEVADEKVAKNVEEHRDKIIDKINILLSSKSETQLKSLKGKEKLKQEILRRLNEILGPSAVKNIYFKQFLIS